MRTTFTPQRCTILLLTISDTPSDQSALRTLLSLLNVEVITGDAAGQLETLLSEPVCALILLDIQTPGQDGLALVDQIRENEAHHSTPILLITDTCRNPAQPRLEPHSVIVEYLEKPLDPERLSARVQLFVELYQARAERDHLRQVSRHQEERLKLAMEGTSDGLWDWDLQTHSVYFSPRWETMLGYSPGEIIPHMESRLRLIHPDDRTNVEKNLQRHLGGETRTYQSRHRLRSRSGEWTWILERARIVARDAAGKPSRVVGTQTDITEIKRLREELDQFFALTPDLLCIASVDGFFLRLNATWENTLGYSVDELMSRPYIEFVHPDDRAATGGAAQILINHKPIYNFTNRYRHRDGGYRWLEWRSRPMGKTIYAVARDITSHKHTEETLRAQREALIQARMEAETASRAKSEFLATISHEIRTPMNVVLGMSEMLLETDLSAQQLHYAQTVYHSGKALMGVINDVLDFSQIESGRLTLNTVPFSPRLLVEQTVQLLRQTAAEKGLTLQKNLSAEVPERLPGDPDRVRQVLTNLLGNALKFTGRGGIEVTLSMVPDARDTMLFTVSDSGIGISQEQMDHIFEQFTQGDTGKTRRYGGTGLGLSISRRLVEMMGGRIWVESRLGVGSTFSFTLPARADHSPAHPNPRQSRPSDQPPASQESSETPTLRVLLAEDVEENRILFEAYLMDSPYQLVLVEDGVEAVEHFKNGGFDVVIMDVQMPRMDGYTAIRLMRQWEQEHAWIPVPILILTAHDQGNKELEACRQAGSDRLLAKPIGKKGLLEALQQIVEARAPQIIPP
ncbi:MAG: PAS domain-containing protein [Magnetococcales bacterium]|nr:PAS domain-containing protein [Magnetococcales bacterium]